MPHAPLRLSYLQREFVREFVRGTAQWFTFSMLAGLDGTGLNGIGTHHRLEYLPIAPWYNPDPHHLQPSYSRLIERVSIQNHIAETPCIAFKRL
jgi:hypothetical protein